MKAGRIRVGAACLAWLLSSSTLAWADEPIPEPPPSEAAPEAPAQPPPAEENPQRAKAREHYIAGVSHVRAARWSEALEAFEKSASLHPNATTSFDIGACERALGRYTQARSTLRRSLREAKAGGMPDATRQEATAFLQQIDGLLATLDVTLNPPEAALLIDGRPLAPVDGKRGSFIAGVLKPGVGKSLGTNRFNVVLNPGAHVVTVSRKGYEDVVVNRSVAPGEKGELRLELSKLPATLRVRSSEPDALVRVNDRDVGPTPIDVRRPPGSYRVIVSKEGFIDYESDVSVKPGEQLDLSASLVVDEPSVFSRWWFWTGAVTVIAGGAVLTYALTRPDPEPPPYDGGSSGWVVFPSSL